MPCLYRPNRPNQMRVYFFNIVPQPLAGNAYFEAPPRNVDRHPRIRRESERILRNACFLTQEAEPPDIRSRRDAGNEVNASNSRSPASGWECVFRGSASQRRPATRESGAKAKEFKECLFYNMGGRAYGYSFPARRWERGEALFSSKKNQYLDTSLISGLAAVDKKQIHPG